MLQTILEILNSIINSLVSPRQKLRVTKVSSNGISLIARHEGLRLKAYLPTPNDRWTIGYGHTHGVHQGMTITEEQALDYLKEDIKWVERAINSSVQVKLSQDQYDAVASFVFNLGATNFRNSTLLKRINEGDFQAAADEFPKWKLQKGVILPGLVKRRAEERKLFLRGTKDDGR